MKPVEQRISHRILVYSLTAQPMNQFTIEDIILEELKMEKSTTMYGLDMLDRQGEWYRWGTDESLENLMNDVKNLERDFRIVRIDKYLTVLEEHILTK